ncbi:inositol monophosphatase family protein [Sediminitomix flava]|uniref:Inositol-1-monophosphatase n=1 Tax=Sediminitomix flava TaxID=379075 RepID=A0A315ZE18_SEDFL|nr:inositol monophosphatase family protein [Sediminitomix flava]PWJ43379.1 myo-inositol-1(or 4)-monophosphatase [Sediminitomix flava]
MGDFQLEGLCKKVVELSEEVGQFIMVERSRFEREDIEYKGTNDMVSYVDKTSEKMIVEKLSDFLPEAGFIAEEGTGTRNEGGYNWIIDPLDGTTNFIHGIPTFAISIALAKGEELLLGVVHEPNRKESFYAWKGGGAYLNGNKIKTSPEPELSRGLIATGFPYQNFQLMEGYMNALQHLMQACHGLRRIGAAAIDLAYVAAGRFEGFFEYDLKPWDVAAGGLIVKEAGGVVTNFYGGDEFIFKGQIIASCQGVTEELTDLIKNNFKGI